MALRTRIHAALALALGSGCLPTPDPDAGMTSSATSGTPSFGDLPPPDSACNNLRRLYCFEDGYVED